MKHSAGFSYVEVLIASVIVVVAIIPGVDALRSGLQSTQAHVVLAQDHFHIASRLEDILAFPFSALDAEALAVGNPAVPITFSDAPGTARRRLIYLARYDGDNADSDGDRFTGGDDGLLWIRIEVENSSSAIESLTSR